MSELDKWNAGGIGNFDASNFPGAYPQQVSNANQNSLEDAFIRGAVIGGVFAVSRARRIYRENAARWIKEGKDPEAMTYKQLNHEANVNIALVMIPFAAFMFWVVGSIAHWW